MLGTPAASLYEVVLAIHIMAVVVTFGVTFAYPIMFAVAARHDPRSLPLLHRIEYTIERMLVNPGLLLVLLAGVYLASKGHDWSHFFVQWGLGGGDRHRGARRERVDPDLQTRRADRRARPLATSRRRRGRSADEDPARSCAACRPSARCSACSC